MTVEKYVADRSGERLDVFLATETELTRSYIKQLIDSGNITLNGKSVKSGAKIKQGD